MTPSNLLRANGNRWQVTCWDGGNRRRMVRTVYAHAADAETAKRIGRRVSGRRCVDARPWDPRTDRSVLGFVREVVE